MIVTWLIRVVEKTAEAVVALESASSFGLPIDFLTHMACHERTLRFACGEPQGESNGRRGWTRTTDLLRVREAL